MARLDHSGAPPVGLADAETVGHQRLARPPGRKPEPSPAQGMEHRQITALAHGPGTLHQRQRIEFPAMGQIEGDAPGMTKGRQRQGDPGGGLGGPGTRTGIELPAPMAQVAAQLVQGRVRREGRHPPPVPCPVCDLEPNGSSGNHGCGSGFPLGADMHTTAVITAPCRNCIGSRDNEAGSRTPQRCLRKLGYSLSAQSSSWLISARATATCSWSRRSRSARASSSSPQRALSSISS